MSSSDTPQAVLDRIEKGYKLGYHKAGKMAEVSKWAQIWVVSDLDDATWESIFIKQFPSVQEAIDAALSLKGKDADVILMPDGCVTVPSITS